MELSRRPDLVEEFLESSVKLNYPVDLGLEELSSFAANLMCRAEPHLGLNMAKLLLYHGQGFDSLVTPVLGSELGRAFIALHAASFSAVLSTIESNKESKRPAYLSLPVVVTLSQPNTIQFGFVEHFGDKVVNILDKRMTPHNLASYNADGLRGLFIVLPCTILAVILSNLHPGMCGLIDGKRDTYHHEDSSMPKDSSIRLDQTLRLLCHYLILIGNRLGLISQEIDIDNLVLTAKSRFCEFALWHSLFIPPDKRLDPTHSPPESYALDQDLPSKAMGSDIFNIPESQLLYQWSSGEHVNEEQRSNAHTSIEQREDWNKDWIDDLTHRTGFPDTRPTATARRGYISHLSDTMTTREDHKGEARRAPLQRETELEIVKRIQMLVVITAIEKLGRRIGELLVEEHGPESEPEARKLAETIRVLIEMDMKLWKLEGDFEGGQLKALLAEVAGNLRHILAESTIDLDQLLAEVI